MQKARRGILVATAGLLLGVFVFGCGGQQAPPPQPTKQGVQADADQFFEELREEEQQRNKGHAPAE